MSTYGYSSRLYPNEINVGDQVLIRHRDSGRYVIDAGTVANGKHGRAWVTVTRCELVRGLYEIDADLNGETIGVGGAPNSKRIVRKPNPTTKTEGGTLR